MADKAEKDLDQASDCGWVRALDANGNPIKIAKADLVELIRANMPVATSDKKGLMSTSMIGFLMNNIKIECDENTDANTLQQGVYSIHNGLTGRNFPSNWGVLVCLGVASQTNGQMFFQSDSSVIYVRSKWTIWSGWRNL